MLAAEDGKEVEPSFETGVADASAGRAEGHIIGAFELSEDGETFARVTERGEQGISGTITVVIIVTGVVGLVGIFDEQVPSFPLPVGAQLAGSYPKRKVVGIQAVVVRDEDRIKAFVLGHITAAETKGHSLLLETRRPLVQMQFDVSSEHGIVGIIPSPCAVIVAVPKAALLAPQGRKVDSPVWGKVDLRAPQSTVNPQETILIEVEDET